MSEWRFRYFFSTPFLGSGFMLWSLFWVNLLGTIYGYIWYWQQLVYTVEEQSPWFLPFVPDSPTASLFFTGAIVYLLLDRRREQHSAISVTGAVGFRGFVEAFAVVTSMKYGIWAVTMIFAAASQGDVLVWQDWMLTFSHLGMAAEALLYLNLYRYRWPSVALVACWAFLNDFMDYTFDVYPRLPRVLEDDLTVIEAYTISLSLISIIVALAMWLIREKRSSVRRKAV
ncbi:DUF1405 domain-containing protein [Paenibacillus allorhizosphaerae]|uniref:DUF1405 domain-containing protein n=1 Tax=Paenibacillus allorhizosphaerae TaxID=2849866 RepID=A0ABN7TTF1_9BACL|nr:DUF1405 domain-containing protein [Paenibacillus allorhizosphaerae]CAG7648830.1 hypothetical protein PAECIP111802_04340 [Paenibacillus allorhizosphaerae]